MHQLRTQRKLGSEGKHSNYLFYYIGLFLGFLFSENDWTKVLIFLVVLCNYSMSEFLL